MSGVGGKRGRTADDGRTERRHGLAGDELPRPTRPPTQTAGVRSRLGALRRLEFARRTPPLPRAYCSRLYDLSFRPSWRLRGLGRAKSQMQALAARQFQGGSEGEWSKYGRVGE